MALTYQINENINKNLKWLQAHNELCDVLLVSGNCKVPAHSCVLSSHSPVLAGILQARLFIQNDWSILKPLIILMDDDEKNSDVKSNDESNSILELLVSFIYGEMITVDPSRIQDLVNMSRLLGLSQHFTDHSLSDTNQEKDSSRKKSRRKYISESENISNKDTDFNTEEEKVDSRLSELDSGNANTNINKKVGCDSVKSIGEKKKKLAKKHKTKTFNAHEFSKRNLKPKGKLKETAATKDDILILPETNSTLLTLSNNLNDTESWFKNELLNCSNTKPSNDKCENVNIQTEDITESLSFTSKECPKSQYKKTTRVAISCSICKSSFYRVNDLIKHIKEETHYSEVCPLCFIQIDEYEDQKTHFLQHDHQLPFFCFWCDLRFRTRADLSMHIPKHSSTKPYSCDECGRSYKWRHSAQAHSVTHRNHCHLLCDICGFSSKYISTFQSHLKRHNGQFFPCTHPGCKYKSFRKTHLNDHLATHEKLRPHQCEVCGYSFSQAKNLRRHMRLHTPDASFMKCSLYSGENCPFKTTRPDKLRFHLVQKHNVRNVDKPTMSVDSNSSNSLQQGENSNSHNASKSNYYTEFRTCDKSSKDEAEPSKELPLALVAVEDSSGSKELPVTENEISMSSNTGGDVFLDEGNSMTQLRREGSPSDDLCVSDSFETYIIPATAANEENSIIVSHGVEYISEGMEESGESEFVLMRTMEEEELREGTDGSLRREDRKEPGPDNKIDEIISALPVILQQEGEGTEYHESGLRGMTEEEDEEERGDFYPLNSVLGYLT